MTVTFFSVCYALVALSAVVRLHQGAAAAPLDSILSHKNIIFTLHGLLDHVDPTKLVREDSVAAACAQRARG